jgi:hypothetical protein
MALPALAPLEQKTAAKFAAVFHFSQIYFSRAESTTNTKLTITHN